MKAKGENRGQEMELRSRNPEFKQTVEKGPSASLRSTASLRRTAKVRLRSSVSRAPRIWNLFDRSGNRVFQHPVKTQNSKLKTQNYLVVLGLLFALAATRCGYHFSGGGEGIPKDIQTVFLEIFVNRSRDVGIEQEMASALRSEFHQRGRLQIVDRIDQADAVLSGVIRSVDNHAVSVNRHDEVLQYEMTLVADTTLRRRIPDEILWQVRRNKLVELYAGSRAAVVTTSSEFKTGTLNSEDVRRLSDIHLTETLSRQAREQLVTRFARELHQRLMETF
jgi:hypothetical protein